MRSAGGWHPSAERSVAKETSTVLTAFLVASAPLAVAPPPPRSFEEAVRVHIQAISHRDLEALEGTLTRSERLDLYLPDGKCSQSRSAFIAFHKSWFAQKGWSIRFTPTSTYVGKDLGTATFKSRCEDIVAGQPYWSENWVTFTFRREGRAWRLVADQNTRIVGH